MTHWETIWSNYSETFWKIVEGAAGFAGFISGLAALTVAALFCMAILGIIGMKLESEFKKRWRNAGDDAPDALKEAT